MADYLFIAGTGRSGTHLVGRTIGSHPDIEKRIENPSTFGYITKLAATKSLNIGLKNFYYKQRILLALNNEIKSCEGKYVLEKSHPSLWIIDFLEQNYPQAKFIGVWREPEPTIASMLNHNGVLSWFNILPGNKVNDFLGITQDNVSYYKNLSLLEKCYLRWKAHKTKIEELERTLGDKFISIKYDEFVINTDKFNDKLSQFIGIENKFNTEPIQIESLNKWQTQLCEEQKELIFKCRERFH